MKAFMLFLLYSGILFLIAGGLCITLVACNGLQVDSLLFACLGLPALFAGLVVGGFGCSYVPKVCLNRTTLETIARVAGARFDIGAAENFHQVFGENCCLWFFPTKPTISGFLWSGINNLDMVIAGQNA
jgi:hypothetical protein